MPQARGLIFGHANQLVRAESGQRRRVTSWPRSESRLAGIEPGRLAQLEERFPYKEEVGGSSPSTPTISCSSLFVV